MSNSTPGSTTGRSVLAVLAGLVTIFATHTGTDEIMHALKIFPPQGQPMYDPTLNFIALAYRCVFSVLGCYFTARLAPRAPMAHALALGGIGVLLSGAGYFATRGMDLGPSWYPLSLVASSLPCAWLGGMLYQPKVTAP